ncbi:MAG TPA: lytic transglycosylase domain-containing protein [Promineifilum sp.]|nr:lytic transglycosylase domain-containing protein [Promineifilum sp.]HQF70488.1 lytic transglycosylase domain-containing protein [Promineifilum sp.]
MTAYQETPIYYVDSPLTQPDDDPYLPWPRSQAADDPMAAVQQRMLLVLGASLAFVVVFAMWAIRMGGLNSVAVDTTSQQTAEQAAPVPMEPAATGGIAPLFTREVQHWAPQIVAWAAEFGLDPNMAATVMQIESCGDPNAVSGSGAQGLFQVMPFHFSAGENMQDPDTNARRGMAYLAQGMQLTGGDTGLSFAGYNGGHGTAAKGWAAWPSETQRYYTWSTGIYQDAVSGSASSETLDQWLAAGGAGLCQQAAARLGLQ